MRAPFTSPSLTPPVLVHRIEKSSYLKAKLALLAPKHKAVKFLWIVADQCVEKFPDREVPTVLLYHEGEMVTKITDITEYGGAGFTLPGTLLPACCLAVSWFAACVRSLAHKGKRVALPSTRLAVGRVGVGTGTTQGVDNRTRRGPTRQALHLPICQGQARR